MSVTVSTRAQANVLLAAPDSVSLKRVAWAFGCAKKDSEAEAALYRLLRERFAKVIAERER